jgi:diguanylate cyclase (GGDEF)-like protein/PAS domain S-box-containing protein
MNKELLSTKNILYVEDDSDAAEEVTFFLQHYVNKLYTATNGQDALEIFQNNPVDLVVTDIQMPKMNGLEMAKAIRKQNASVPIIIVSAFNESSMLLEAIELGIDAYLLKPLSLSKLLEKIEILLHPKELERELSATNERLKLLKKLEKTEKELLLYKERVDFAFRATKEGLWDWNIVTGEVYYSPRWKEMIGYRDDELGNTLETWEKSVYPQDLQKAKAELEKIFSHKKDEYAVEFRLIHKDGNLVWILARGTVEFDSDGKPVRMIGTHQDISSRKEMEFELQNAKRTAENLAITDGLTGLYNRRYFNETIEKELNRSKRDEKHIAFMMLDIDYFKNYNDYYGHLKGDDTLIAVAEVFKEFSERAEDTAFRVGGEEFGIIFFPKTLLEAEEYANKIVEKVASLHIEHIKNKVAPYVTISAGVMFKRYDVDMSPDELYQKADAALYEAKQNGRNQYKVKDV